MASDDDSRDNVRFADRVSPGSTETLRHELDRPATVEFINVRIYPGAELDLELVPFGENREGSNRWPLVTLEGKSHIDGDSDRFEFDVSEPIADGEYIGVEATNQDGANAYDYAVDYTVEYAGGLRRLVSAAGRVI
jgi:hypothetical protein